MPYSCGFCGKEFDNIEARAKCELQCAERIRKEEERKKKELAELERAAAEKEVLALQTKYLEKRSEYIKKYGKYPVVKRIRTDDSEADTFADFVSEILRELAD